MTSEIGRRAEASTVPARYDAVLDKAAEPGDASLMEIDARIRAAADALSDRLGALFLAGSHGRGNADAVSDIDLLGIAPQADHADLMGHWKTALEAQVSLVLWQQPFPGLTNAISRDWVRVDLYLVAPDRLKGRAKSTLKPLHDPDGLWQGLPETLPPAKPNPATVLRLTNEFLRVLGLMQVGLVREEYVLLVRGAGLLRDMLMDLMLETCPVPDRGGMLHPSKLLSPAQMASLAALPAPRAERNSVIAASLAIAELFLPLARDLAGDAYPTAFEHATRAHLARSGVALL